jgi:hypothetical protein
MNLPSQLQVVLRLLLQRSIPEFVWPEAVSIDEVNIKVSGQQFPIATRTSKGSAR